jgi:hypothetical protein
MQPNGLVTPIASDKTCLHHTVGRITTNIFKNVFVLCVAFTMLTVCIEFVVWLHYIQGDPVVPLDGGTYTSNTCNDGDQMLQT